MAKRGKKFFAVYLAGVFLPLLLVSCNFFSWLNPPMPGANADSLVAEGDKYFNGKQFQLAMTTYSNALVYDPGCSKARLGYARSALWLFLPDFMYQVSAQYETDANATIYSVLLNIFNSEEGRKAILSGAGRPFYESIVSVLDSPEGVVNGKGDQQITADNFEANIMLVIAYGCDLFLSLLDSNGDGVYGSTNNDLIFVTNGVLGFNEKVLSVQSNVQVLFDVNVSNSVSQTLSNIQAGHDDTEYFLSLMKLITSKIGYADKIYAAMLRPKPYLLQLTTNLIGTNYIGGYATLYDSMEDAYTNSNSFSPYGTIFYYSKMTKATIEKSSGLLNDLHKVLVGSYAYTGGIENFEFTPWDTHNGGLKATVSAFGDLTNLLTTTNIDDLEYELTNNFSISEISNMLIEFANMFGISY